MRATNTKNYWWKRKGCLESRTQDEIHNHPRLQMSLRRLYMQIRGYSPLHLHAPGFDEPFWFFCFPVRGFCAAYSDGLVSFSFLGCLLLPPAPAPAVAPAAAAAASSACSRDIIEYTRPPPPPPLPLPPEAATMMPSASRFAPLALNDKVANCHISTLPCRGAPHFFIWHFTFWCARFTLPHAAHFHSPPGISSCCIPCSTGRAAGPSSSSVTVSVAMGLAVYGQGVAPSPSSAPDAAAASDSAAVGVTASATMLLTLPGLPTAPRP
mmetsp:Transcript_9556/g.23578  ORF Transcript_9556/g.23578 Transcript_9556/m.23578 type:complete len:267 (-) Transcript_9556:862-1662(-)